MMVYRQEARLTQAFHGPCLAGQSSCRESHLCALKSMFENPTALVPAQYAQPFQGTVPHFTEPTWLMREPPYVHSKIPCPGKADWFRGRHLTQLDQSDSFPEISELELTKGS